MTYAIQMLPSRTPVSDDAPWEPVRLEPTVDTNDLGAMLRAVEDLEFDADGQWQYRYVEVPEEPAYDYVDHWVPAESRWVKIATPVTSRKVA